MLEKTKVPRIDRIGCKHLYLTELPSYEVLYEGTIPP